MKRIQGFIKTNGLAEQIRSLPAGLDRAILRVLSFHVGREKAISRSDLLRELDMFHGFRVDDRSVRECINQLRKTEHHICSSGGTNGGYWMAASWQELDEYIQQELHSRAMDLLEQESALRRGAEKRWGADMQPSLF